MEFRFLREMEMPASTDTRVHSSKGDGRAAGTVVTALGEILKGVKAIAFYPEGHPLRREILHRAYQAIRSLMNGEGFSLIVHRNGLSIAGGDGEIENAPIAISLAKELFSREIQQLTLLPELSHADFTEFLLLLAMEPQKVLGEGGMAELLDRRGIRTVIANEIDIAAVFTKRTMGEPTEEAVSEGTEARHGKEGETGTHDEEPPQPTPAVPTIEELLALMEKEQDDITYANLARMLVAKGQALKAEENFDRLFPLLLGLLNQNADEMRSADCRANALDAFRQLARDEMAEHLLDHLGDEDFKQKEIVYMILHHLGRDVVGAIIDRITACESPHIEKTLTTALLRIGPPAIPPLLDVLKDGRRQFVRTAVAVLGEMGNRDAVRGLSLTAYHVDNRIRIDAIHSLARIGGKEATEVLLDLLRDANRAIRRQVILWLGITKNERAVQPLLNLILERDIMGKSLTLKKEALLAIGRIGDRRALEPLFRLVRKRHLLARGRWEELKILAIEAIGRIGGDSALEFLEKTEVRGGSVGWACSAVLETMGRKPGNDND
jgi:HEAT repeat protein